MKFLVLFLEIIPSNLLSRLFGKWASIEFPSKLQLFFNWAFSKCCQIDLRDCGKGYSDFKTVNQLFTRVITMEDRPVGEGFVSPCDGKLLHFATCYRGMAVQAKNQSYSLGTLVGDENAEKSLCWHSTIYLSPQNYHRAHVPLNCELVRAVHIPGDLFPVNDIFLPYKPNIFLQNERVSFELYHKELDATFYLVMVGAYNVGSVSSPFFPELQTNLGGQSTKTLKPRSKVSLKKGDEIATFELGSTIILAMEQPFGDAFNFTERFQATNVKIGQSLYP